MPCVPVLSLRRSVTTLMYSSSYDPKNQPLFFISGHPVRLATLLVLVHVVMLILTASVGPAMNDWLELKAYTPMFETAIRWPSWWQWGTYFLSNFPSVWFLIDMYFLWVFGTQLEQIMGRQFLARLYLLLIALGSLLVLTTLVTGLSTQAGLAGPRIIHFCIFMAIAFLHPNASVFCTPIKLKYLAGAFFAIHVLQFTYMRSWLGCSILAVSTIATYIIMRRYGLTPRFTRVANAFSAALPRPRRKAVAQLSRYEPKLLPRPEVREDRTVVVKIDAILDKIARSGLDSLTAEERKQLERASSELKRQDD